MIAVTLVAVIALLRPPSIVVTVSTPPQAEPELTAVTRALKSDYLGAGIPRYRPVEIASPPEPKVIEVIKVVQPPEVEVIPMPKPRPRHPAIGKPLQIVPRYYLYQ